MIRAYQKTILLAQRGNDPGDVACGTHLRVFEFEPQPSRGLPRFVASLCCHLSLTGSDRYINEHDRDFSSELGYGHGRTMLFIMMTSGERATNSVALLLMLSWLPLGTRRFKSTVPPSTHP